MATFERYFFLLYLPEIYFVLILKKYLSNAAILFKYMYIYMCVYSVAYAFQTLNIIQWLQLRGYCHSSVWDDLAGEEKYLNEVGRTYSIFFGGHNYLFGGCVIAIWSEDFNRSDLNQDMFLFCCYGEGWRIPYFGWTMFTPFKKLWTQTFTLFHLLPNHLPEINLTNFLNYFYKN